jgi:spore coat polysaccharide biosynthesis protein SpsF
MKTVIIIQTRMTSTRLPGKVLMDVAGHPMLAQQLRRVKACRETDEIVVATTTNKTDDPVVALAEKEGVRWFRGSEDDVLGRYAGAAREANADVVVRITSDCPLIDPGMSDRVVGELKRHAGDCDYAHNIAPRTYPRGLDTEAFFRDTLERLHRLSSSPAAREHVTHFLLEERPELFVTRSVADTEDNSDLRWTVDTAADLAMVRKIYDDLGLDARVAPYREILQHVRAHPEIAAINAHVPQKAV